MVTKDRYMKISAQCSSIVKTNWLLEIVRQTENKITMRVHQSTVHTS